MYIIYYIYISLVIYIQLPTFSHFEGHLNPFVSRVCASLQEWQRALQLFHSAQHPDLVLFGAALRAWEVRHGGKDRLPWDFPIYGHENNGKPGFLHGKKGCSMKCCKTCVYI